MHLLFVVDGRSPIALNWIPYFVEQGDKVHVVSTYPCRPELDLASLKIIPVAFSDAGGTAISKGQGSRAWLRRLIPVGMRTAIRQRLGPLTLPPLVSTLQKTLAEIEPDLVHAMRIPYEGMLAALAEPACPLLVSTWGNDFTLHAPATRWMGRATRRTLERAEALHADCQRDIRLAHDWGFSMAKPYRVLPGSGGIQLDQFSPAGAPPSESLVINPRGFRAYVRNDAFFQAIPIVLQRQPQARFICTAMTDEAQAQAWVKNLGISAQVELLPYQTRERMAELFRSAQVVVSPSTHDGTPNTLLEAIACGCFPVAGDLESLREWITPGTNGLLVDPGDPQALAEAIVQALSDADLRLHAASFNRRLIEERAAYPQVMAEARRFYQEIISGKE